MMCANGKTSRKCVAVVDDDDDDDDDVVRRRALLANEFIVLDTKRERSLGFRV